MGPQDGSDVTNPVKIGSANVGKIECERPGLPLVEFTAEMIR